MPRTTFAGSLLDGANNGLGRLAQSIAQGQNTYQDAFDRETALQSRLAQAIAQQQQSQAAAAESTEKTRGLRLTNDRLAQLPDLADEQAAYGAGASVPLVRAVRDAIRSGGTAYLPGVEMAGPNPDGSAGVKVPVPDDQRSRIVQELRRNLPVLLNDGKVAPGDWAKSLETYGNMDLRDDVLAGRRSAGAVAQAQAAEKGGDQFKTGSDGQVLNPFSGAVDVNNPVAQAGLTYKRAQTAQANAGAAAHSAAAEASRAGKPNLQVVTTDDGRIVVVDKNTARATPAIGADGKPVTGKGGTLNGEQANALAFSTRMQAANEVLDRLAALGVDQRGKLKQAVGDMAFAGALANGAQSDEQQQVEQAQRDFINAVLRRESGAAIGQNEFENAARQYFPQPNDKPGVLRQKAEARQRAVQTMLAAVPPNLRTLPAAPGAAASAPSTPAQPAAPAAGKRVVRTGTDAFGRRVAQYEDGSIGYAD